MSLSRTLAETTSALTRRDAQVTQLEHRTEAFRARAVTHHDESVISANARYLSPVQKKWEHYDEAMQCLRRNGFAAETKARYPELVQAFLTRLIDHNLTKGKTAGKAAERLSQIVDFISAWEIDSSVLASIPNYATYPGLKVCVEAPSSDSDDERRARRSKKATRPALSSASDSPPEIDPELLALTTSFARVTKNLSAQVEHVRGGGKLSDFPGSTTPPAAVDDRRLRAPSAFNSANPFRNTHTGTPSPASSTSRTSTSPTADTLLGEILSEGKDKFVAFCHRLHSTDHATLVELHHKLAEQMKTQSSPLYNMFRARTDTVFGSLAAPSLIFEDGTSIKVSQTLMDGLETIHKHIVATSPAATTDLGRSA